MAYLTAHGFWESSTGIRHLGWFNEWKDRVETECGTRFKYEPKFISREITMHSPYIWDLDICGKCYYIARQYYASTPRIEHIRIDKLVAYANSPARV